MASDPNRPRSPGFIDGRGRVKTEGTSKPKRRNPLRRNKLKLPKDLRGR